MSRFRLLAAALAATALAGAGARAQAILPRVLVDRFAPPPIDRGISPVMSRAPDSPETRARLSVRPLSTVVDRRGASGLAYVPGRVIVKFRDAAAGADRAAALAGVSRTARLLGRPSSADFDMVAIDPGEDAERVAKTLAERDDVEYAQPAYRVYPQFVPNDTDYPKQWNLPLVDMERAWDIQPAAGSSIVVAVLDTGVAFTDATVRFHADAFSIDTGGLVGPPGASGATTFPALGDLTLSFVAAPQLASAGRFVKPHDFIWDDDLPLDLDGHGTHVSGTIGQITNDGAGTAGVAFNVKIMPVKVLDSAWDDIFGSPNFASDDLVARGIRYAADNGANVINMSLGRPGPDPSPVMEAAINYAVGKGVFVSMSAGNDGEDPTHPITLPAEIATRVHGAVSVAAVDRNATVGDRRCRGIPDVSPDCHAYYSSTGPWVELAAPGGSFRGFDAEGGILQQTLDLDLVETYDDPQTFTAPRFDSLAYFYFTGTSQASPHVSGVAAMLMQQGITDPAAVEAALERFAVDLGDPGRDDRFGFGLIDARDALRGLGLAR